MLTGLSLQVQRTLVHEILMRHPLPWRIEHDWTVEVLDAKDRCVAKLMSDVDAQAFIRFAQELSDEMTRQDAIIIKELLDGDDS
jgi:hypothetical protein